MSKKIIEIPPAPTSTPETRELAKILAIHNEAFRLGEDSAYMKCIKIIMGAFPYWDQMDTRDRLIGAIMKERQE